MDPVLLGDLVDHLHATDCFHGLAPERVLPFLLCLRRVLQITEGQDSNIWVATENSRNRFDPQSGGPHLGLLVPHPMNQAASWQPNWGAQW